MKVESSLFEPGTHIHLVGIGGAGLSAIARVLMGLGCRVSGSDQAASALTAALSDEGATVYTGHRAEQVAGADVLVVSSAIPAHNVELRAARERGIPLLKRADFLGEMMAGRVAVAIAGSHGKTTTSGMMSTVLLAAGHDPSFIVGGQIAHLGTNARAGAGPFVIEADEYDRTFLGLKPTIAVVTNVEHDHPDCYPTFDEFRAAFEAFVELLPEDGLLVVCADDPEARALGEHAAAQGKAVVRYGLNEDADWRAVDAQPNGAGGCDYVALVEGKSRGLVRLRIPGSHNVVNSLAVLAVADALGVPFDTLTQALRDFRGMGRRFEIKGVANGVTVVDDYAHHPTEIRATLSAARENYPGRQVWAVWQPHTYSRVKALLDDFATAFADADHVIVTPIYAAREKDDLGVSSAAVVTRMDHRDVRVVADLDQAVDVLEAGLRSNDVVLTLGAGDSDVVGDKLLERLGKPANLQTCKPANLQTCKPANLQTCKLANLKSREPLGRYTSSRVGGPADWLVVVESLEALVEAVRAAQADGLPWRIVGGGSDLLVSDAGVRGLVVVNKARQVVFQEAYQVYAESGANLGSLARSCVARGWAGLEWAVGVPGTVGGAVVGNAGAHEGEMSCALKSVTMFEADLQGGTVVEWPVERMAYRYRSSLLKRSASEGDVSRVVLAATLALEAGDRARLSRLADKFMARRKKVQPSKPSFGSMFKNPPGDYAGRLIEAAGLKGTQIGGAQISPLHANFFVNTGDASAADVKALIDLAQERVREQFDVALELEVEMVGEW